MEHISEQKNLASDAAGKWAELVPKIFKLAEAEDHPKINNLFGDLEGDLSSGK